MRIASLLLFLCTAVNAQIGAIITRPGGTNGQIQYNNNGRFGGTDVVAGVPPSVGIATQALAVNISTETAARIAADFAIGASTKALNSAKVDRAGDTMTGNLSFGSGTIRKIQRALSGGAVDILKMTEVTPTAGTFNLGGLPDWSAGSISATGSLQLNSDYIYLSGYSVPTQVSIDGPVSAASSVTASGQFISGGGFSSTGGDARGLRATDLQTSRGSSGQVAAGATSVLVGGSANTIGSSAYSSAILGGQSNTVSTGYMGAIAGGESNTVAGDHGFIGAGISNSIGADSSNGVIGGGNTNSINDSSDPTYPSVVGGGRNNSAYNSSVVGGGHNNGANYGGAILGGYSNSAGTSFAAFVGAGDSNNASGTHSAIPGGQGNTASGAYAAIPGGISNSATGAASFSAGNRCKATAAGAFCLSDTTGSDFTNSTVDSLAARFSGGYNMSGGSFSATSFWGDGSHLTGVAAGSESNTYVSSKTYTDSVLIDGDLSVGGGIIGPTYLNMASMNASIDANGAITSVSSVTASGFFGNGSALTGLSTANVSGVSCVPGTGLFSIACAGDNSDASGAASVIGGGESNVASGENATVPGGYYNQAIGVNSFAAGQQAVAANDGSFVWADNTATDYSSVSDNTFNARATGGFNFAGGQSAFESQINANGGLYSDQDLTVNSSQQINTGRIVGNTPNLILQDDDGNSVSILTDTGIDVQAGAGNIDISGEVGLVGQEVSIIGGIGGAGTLSAGIGGRVYIKGGEGTTSSESNSGGGAIHILGGTSPTENAGNVYINSESQASSMNVGQTFIGNNDGAASGGTVWLVGGTSSDGSVVIGGSTNKNATVQLYGHMELAGYISGNSSITASAFFGNGSKLTGLSVDFSTITSALQSKLSSGAIPSGFVDFSTITSALQSKLSSGAIPSGFVNFSTITLALQSKLSSGAIPSGFVDFSTITLALQSKLSSGAIPSGFVDFSTITSALQSKLSSGTIPTNFVDLSTVSTRFDTKASTGTDGTITRTMLLRSIDGSLSVGSIVMNSSTSTFTGKSSVTASGFFGDGSQLTGVVAGTVGVSSSCSAGQYWDNATFLNGVSNGGQCTSVSAGSEGNTYTSSKTFTSDVLIKGGISVLGQETVIGSHTVTGAAAFMGKVGIGESDPSANLDILSNAGTTSYIVTVSSQDDSHNILNVLGSGQVFIGNSLYISTTGGIVSGGGTSTMTPCGPLFFISSETVVGSTATQTTVLTSFSTFTLRANTLVNPGDTVLVECAFNQTTAPGTPVAGVYNATVRGAGASVVANADIIVQSIGRLVKTGRMHFINSAWSETAAATALVSVTTSAGLNQVAFDATVDQDFFCRASRASGGTINFTWMRVSKSCN